MFAAIQSTLDMTHRVIQWSLGKICTIHGRILLSLGMIWTILDLTQWSTDTILMIPDVIQPTLCTICACLGVWTHLWI